MANYVEMWKELGMDLEAHDALCAVLPTAFGDVYLSQENRPEGMGFWDMVVADIHGIRPAELIEAQKKGQELHAGDDAAGTFAGGADFLPHFACPPLYPGGVRMRDVPFNPAGGD